MTGPTAATDYTDILTPEVEEARYQRGKVILDEVTGTGGQDAMASLADIAPAMAQHVVAFGFGEVYSRPGLSPQQRQLITIGILTTLGGCEAQLEVHIKTSLNVGLTPTEIVEAVTHAAMYCGFPRALNAIAVVKRVFGERGLLPVASDH